MGSAMAKATTKTNAIVTDLESKINTLASDAEWRGIAGDAFRATWSRSAFEIGSLNAAVTEAGTTIKALGDTLADLEAELHNSAADYAAKGVPIGPSGEPQTVVVTGDPSVSPAKDVLQAANEYKELYDSTMLLAKKARNDAANSLSEMLGIILPPDGGEDPGLGLDDKATAASFIRGLLTANNEKRDVIDGLRESRRAALNDARRRFKETRGPLRAAKAEYAAKGLKLPATSEAARAHSQALKNVEVLADRLGKTVGPERVLLGSDWLNIKLADLAGDSTALNKVLPKLGFLKNVPVLDIAATGLIGGIQGYEDHNMGRGTLQSYSSNVVTGAAGLGAGALVVAAAPASAPALGVAVVAGGVVVGVGNIASAMVDEHWMDNIQQHGVVAGIAEGVGHSVSNGAKATYDQVKDVGKAVWSGIFG